MKLNNCCNNNFNKKFTNLKLAKNVRTFIKEYIGDKQKMTRQMALELFLIFILILSYHIYLKYYNI